MTDYGIVQVGRLTLRETYALSDSTDPSGVRTVTITGQESSPPLTVLQCHARREDIMGLAGYYVPCLWRDKAEYNGYYQVQTATATLTNNTGETVTVDWSITMLYIGPDNAVDIESRVSGTIRQTDFNILSASTAVRTWGLPPAAYGVYFGDLSVLGVVSRNNSQGADVPNVVLQASVINAASTFARWGVAANAYLGGRAMVLQDGIERTGTNITMTTSGWQIDNGIVNVSAAPGGQLNISAYTSGAYHAKLWNVSIAGSANGTQLTSAGYAAVEVLRNDPEMVTVRLTLARTTDTSFSGYAPVVGRGLLDLSLRRGARFLEGYLQCTPGQLGNFLDTTNIKGIWLNTAETSSTWVDTPGTGKPYLITANAADASGNRYFIGSLHNFSVHASGGISNFSAVTSGIDFYVGVVPSNLTGVVLEEAVGNHWQTQEFGGAMTEQVVMVPR